MRIACVSETYPPDINGVAMTVGRLVDGLKRRQHEVRITRPRLPGETLPRSEQGDLLVTALPIPGYPDLRMGWPARSRLMAEWRAWRPDLVHVVTEGPLGWAAVDAARRLGVPCTSGYHTHFDHYSQHYGAGWLGPLVTAGLRRLHNHTRLTFVPTEALANTLRNSGYRAVDVIARGIDRQLFNPIRRSEALRKKWGAGADTLVVLYVGRIAKEKNLALLGDAFEALLRRHPESRLVIVGDGPARNDLQRRWPHAVFTGMQRGESLAAHYASGDLFLFPSLSETFGNVILEAMASGLPTVAFDRAAASLLIKSGKSGWLCEAGNRQAFIAASLAAASARREIGSAAIDAVADWDWEAIHDRFAETLCRVAQDIPEREPSARAA